MVFLLTIVAIANALAVVIFVAGIWGGRMTHATRHDLLPDRASDTR